MAKVNQEREERASYQLQLNERQLKVQEAMAANIELLKQEMDATKEQIHEGNKSSKRDFWSMFIVAILTLIIAAATGASQIW